MPFLAHLDDDVVIPEEVEDGISVRCLDCEEEMVPRGPFSDGRARHFAHLSATQDCSGWVGGESDTHRKLKSLAISSLRHQFEGQYNLCEPEVDLSVRSTATFPDTRRADVLLEFGSENEFYGKGIIIEVQYKNHSKDVFATTHDYLSLGYSVFWADPSDFEDDQLPFDAVEGVFNDRDDRRGVSVYSHDPGDFSTEVAASLEWSDPEEDCSHSWEDVEVSGREYESCPHCGTNRMYDEERTRFLYDGRELLGPSAESPDDLPSSRGCGPEGHIWEPGGRNYDQCARCSFLKVELDQYYDPEVILGLEYQWKDLSELTANPDACQHRWDTRGAKHQCQDCGLIDSMPY